MEKKHTPQYIKDRIVNYLLDLLIKDDYAAEEKKFGPDDLKGKNIFSETKFIDGVKTSPSASHKMKSALKMDKPSFLKPIEPTRLKSAIRGKVIAEVIAPFKRDIQTGDLLEATQASILLSYKGEQIFMPIQMLLNQLKDSLLGMKLFDVESGKLLMAVFAIDADSLGLK